MKPRILQLVDSFNEGGSERQALHVTRLLRDTARYEMYLATLNPEGVLRADAETLVREIPSYPLKSFYDHNAGVQLSDFVRYLRTNRIDLIHTHDFYTNIFGMTAGFLAGVRARIASRRETNCMRSTGQLLVQRLAYASAHHIVANSQAVRTKLVEEGINEKRITIIYNGIDTARFQTPVSALRDESLRSLGLENAIPYRSLVTVIANMRHEVKDYPMFLNAAMQVKKEVPGTGFLIAGEGQLRASIEKLATELGLVEDTFFLGRCQKISALLNVSDICVLSSMAEGFSNSILEYMAAGRPVVATNVGGAKEAIVEGETGYLVDSGDSAAMARRIVSLLLAPEKASAMGQRGKQRIEERFSSRALLQNTEALYDTLLKDRPVRNVRKKHMFPCQPSRLLETKRGHEQT